jgi:hypothetical protein
MVVQMQVGTAPTMVPVHVKILRQHPKRAGLQPNLLSVKQCQASRGFEGAQDILSIRMR